MSKPIESEGNLWSAVVACSLETEIERDFLGRQKRSRTTLFLRAKLSPELIEALERVSAAIATGQKAVIESARSAARRLVIPSEIVRPFE